MLSENIIAHVVRLHRVLSHQKNANIVLVGPIGSHLSTLCRLALHMNELEIHQMDTSKYSTFMDGLRSAIRMTGTEGKILTIFLDGRQLTNDQYLDAINSVLISGEYPHLFSNDEMDGLLQALQPIMKRELPHSSASLHDYFVSRVKSNLHIILCLPPSHNLLSNASYDFPGLFTHCQVIWLNDWPKAVLLGDANYYIHKNKVCENCSPELTNRVVTALANMHVFVLEECGQMNWAGDTNPQIHVKELKYQEKKKEQIKITDKKVSNKPYSKNLLIDAIKRKQKFGFDERPHHVFVGPTTFRRFLETFHQLLKIKSTERTDKIAKLEKALVTLDQTRKDVKKTKAEIKQVSQKYEAAKQETNELLNNLIKRATLLEKIKAKVLKPSALLAFLQMSDDENGHESEVEEDELLEQAAKDERDNYDEEFEKLREANLRSREVKAHEELQVAEKNVATCQEQLEYARKQVNIWRSKVDRSTIDRLKGFTNPTVLVGQVIEMVMILIGKRPPTTRLGDRPEYPKDESSTRFSASSSSTKVVNPPQRLKRE